MHEDPTGNSMEDVQPTGIYVERTLDVVAKIQNDPDFSAEKLALQEKINGNRENDLDG